MNSTATTATPKQYTHPSPAWQMRLLATGYHIPRCLHVVAELDIATRLADSARPASDIAGEAGVDGPTLHRVMRALASVDVFQEIEGGRFINTALSETLRSDRSGSLRSWVVFYGDEPAWRSWGEFSYSVRTGRSSFEHLYGANMFEYLSHQPERSRIFDEAMSAVTTLASDAIAAAYDCSNIKLLVDVGGGNATMLCSLLRANPHMQGMVFDLPHVATSATTYIASQSLGDRCKFVAGDFFASVPEAADAYFLQRVLHDWDDEHCIQILHTCANAARPGAKLLISEAIIPPGNEPFIGKLIDLHMLVMTHGGRERSLAEYRGLLAKAGWAYTRVVPTASPYSVIEGVKN
jgi:hypothetical protein